MFARTTGVLAFRQDYPKSDGPLERCGVPAITPTCVVDHSRGSSRCFRGRCAITEKRIPNVRVLNNKTLHSWSRVECANHYWRTILPRAPWKQSRLSNLVMLAAELQIAIPE